MSQKFKPQLTVRKNEGTDIRRPRLNFDDTASVTWTVTDDTTNLEIDISATATAASVGANAFTTIDAPAGTDPVATSPTDTLTLTSTGSTVDITGTAGTDTVNFDVDESDLTLDNIGGTLSISKGGTSNTTATAAFDALAPTTTKGDVIVHNGTDNVRLGVGTDGFAIVADSAQSEGIKWAAVAGSSPLTTKGDLFTYDTGDQRLPVGSNDEFLVADSGEATGLRWESTLDIANGGTGETTQTAAFNALDPLTTKGDVIVHNGTNSVRLAVGTDTFLLQADSGASEGVSWVSPSAASSPLTTKGDLFTYDTGDQRLPVGSDGDILAANSSESTGLEWVTGLPSSAGSGTDNEIVRWDGTTALQGSDYSIDDADANEVLLKLNRDDRDLVIQGGSDTLQHVIIRAGQNTPTEVNSIILQHGQNAACNVYINKEGNTSPTNGLTLSGESRTIVGTGGGLTFTYSGEADFNGNVNINGDLFMDEAAGYDINLKEQDATTGGKVVLNFARTSSAVSQIYGKYLNAGFPTLSYPQFEMGNYGFLFDFSGTFFGANVGIFQLGANGDTCRYLFRNNSAQDIMDITGNRNVRFFGAAAPSTGSGVLCIKNAPTAPTASITDGVLLYSEDVSSSAELKVRDEAGNITTLSPHRFELFQPQASEPTPFSYWSINEYLGYRINVDFCRALRDLEAITGNQYIYTDTITQKSWNDEQNALKDKHDAIIADWGYLLDSNGDKIDDGQGGWEKDPEHHDNNGDLLPTPSPYERKEPPQYIKDRIGWTGF